MTTLHAHISPLRKAPQILAGLSLIMLMLVGGYWHIFGSPFHFNMTPRTMATLGQDMTLASDRFVNKHFNMGGVRLGMTPPMVRALYPSVKMAQGRGGKPAITIATRRGMLVAWLDEDKEFTQVDGQLMNSTFERIYRLRLDEAYADLSEQQLIDSYARTYGRPLQANCNRNQLGDSPRCTYRWWGGNGVELIAMTKRKIDANGQVYVLLTTIATNTLKSSKLVAAPLGRVNG